MVEHIEELQVGKVIGHPTPYSVPAFVTWAHRPPKEVFKLYCRYALDSFSHPLIVIIDDITPNLVEDREKHNTKLIAEQHRSFFTRYGAIPFLLSEEMVTYEYLSISKYISLSRMLHYLPSRKRTEELLISDVLHFINNVYAYYVAAKIADVFLLGENVVGRFYAAREIIKEILRKQVSAIIFKFVKR